jgi:hypothetical protein
VEEHKMCHRVIAESYLFFSGELLMVFDVSAVGI